MFFARVNRDKSDKAFISVLNVEASTITTGNPVAHAIVTTIDGVAAVMANTAAKSVAFLGVALRDIASNDYGLVQVGGFVNSILLSNVGTSLTINAGDPLVPGPAGFFSGAPTYANSGLRVVFASNVPPAISAAAYASGILKFL